MPQSPSVSQKFHLALGVHDIEESIREYSQRLGQPPQVVIPQEYALWRTDTLNVSIRKVSKEQPGGLRHLGWEQEGIQSFRTEIDCNHIPWEYFTADQQAQEIARDLVSPYEFLCLP